MRCQREIGPGGSDVGVDCMTAGELSGAPVRQRGQAACQSLWRLMLLGMCLGLLGERVGSGIVKAARRRGESGVARIGNWEGGGWWMEMSLLKSLRGGGCMGMEVGGG